MLIKIAAITNRVTQQAKGLIPPNQDLLVVSTLIGTVASRIQVTVVEMCLLLLLLFTAQLMIKG